jgi:hypothetical protein
MVGIFKRQELLTLREHLGSSPVFGGVRVVHLSIFLCCGFYFVFLRPVSGIPNVELRYNYILCLLINLVMATKIGFVIDTNHNEY